MSQTKQASKCFLPQGLVRLNLVNMGREGFALGFSLARIQADANCKEQWERDATEEGYLSAHCAAQMFA